LLKQVAMKHPSLVWEARAADGRVVSCLLESAVYTHAVVQYVDGEFAEVEEFTDLRAAKQRTRTLYAQVVGAAAMSNGRIADSPRRNVGPLFGRRVTLKATA
jgi:hypothetical protein